MAGILRRIVRALYNRLWLSPLGYGRPVPAQAWEDSFSAGRWNFLSDPSESVRYSVIRNYAALVKSPADILDVGCGAGVLRSVFAESEIVSYLGLDISKAAVAIANDAGYAKSRFVAQDFEAPAEEATYDLIIFNESIYYALDPRATFQRYMGRVRPGGAYIISMYHYDGQTRRQWKRLEGFAKPRYSTQLVNEKGKRWDVRLYFRDDCRL